MAKIGRNEPCPCGSGKKYKHCCYGTVPSGFAAENVWKQDPEWYKIRLTEAEAIDGILGFAAKQYGDDFLKEALAEFSIWGEYPFDELHGDSFLIPWVAFTWIPEIDENETQQKPLGLLCLEEHAGRLGDYQQRFIRAACSEPFSFFSVTGTVPGKSLELRDIFLNRTFTVKEARASTSLKRGDIIFARVVPLDGQAIVVGMAPVAIPPREHPHLLDIRDEIKKEMREAGFEFNLESLREWDLEMRDLYLGAAEFLANPPRPELQNTDGDPISFVTLYLELGCSVQEAFDRLQSLALYESQEEILEDETRDGDEILLEVSFDWLRKGNKKHKSWDNTILGRLTIKGNSLTAEVNSEKRAKKIQSEIAKRLGKKAVFKRAVHESTDAKLEELEARSGTPEFEAALREREEFQSLPEVQAIVKAQMEAHWEGWYNERVPALQNKTPLEAARTKGGRERLEALFLDFERTNENVPHPSLRVDVAAMRKKLGL
ncbi:MAG TPA: SEC-C metal-binding domain-containing protein [Blastocatellia bacterium]|nr:SEC-C metal-binding domain-containing protein [Blastocatellia bacterium]